MTQEEGRENNENKKEEKGAEEEEDGSRDRRQSRTKGHEGGKEGNSRLKQPEGGGENSDLDPHLTPALPFMVEEPLYCPQWTELDMGLSGIAVKV